MRSIPDRLWTVNPPGPSPMLGAVMLEPGSGPISLDKETYLSLLADRLIAELQEEDDPDQLAADLGRKLVADGVLEEAPLGLSAPKTVRMIFGSLLFRMEILNRLGIKFPVKVTADDRGLRETLQESDPMEWANHLVPGEMD